MIQATEVKKGTVIVDNGCESERRYEISAEVEIDKAGGIGSVNGAVSSGVVRRSGGEVLASFSAFQHLTISYRSEEEQEEVLGAVQEFVKGVRVFAEKVVLMASSGEPMNTRDSSGEPMNTRGTVVND